MNSKTCEIKYKKHDKTLSGPVQKTSGSAGADLCAREETTILGNCFGYIPLNVSIKAPENSFVILAARSSLHKTGLIPANGIGIMDTDFCGDNDEYKLIVFNTKSSDVKIEKGQRVAQIILFNKLPCEFTEVDSLDSPDRGGIGSTGRF